MDARDVILGRVRAALRDVSAEDEVVVPRAYRRREDGDPVERFVNRVSEYRATVATLSVDGLPTAIAERCRERGVRRVAVPADVPPAWLPEGIDLVDEREADGALTGCALAVAETGTIVLDGGARQGARSLSLVPDYHLCVVEAEQIVGSLPEATPLLAAALWAGRPLTLISGPSATSDIELSRVEGVHGPRTLDVYVVTG